MADINVSKLDRDVLFSTSRAREIEAQLFNQNREYLVQDKPRFTVAALSRETVLSTRPAVELKQLFQVSREFLYIDNPRFRVWALSRETVLSTRPARELKFLYQVTREIIYRQTAITLTHVSREFLVQVDQTPTIHAQALQVMERVFSAAIWPTVAETISIERVLQSAQMALRFDPLAMPISYEYVGQVLTKVLAAYPIDSTVGIVQTRQVVFKVLQSDTEEHESVSMDYVKALAQYSLYASPLPMYRSPAYAMTTAMAVLQKTPMGFLPHSDTTAVQSVFKVLQKSDPEFQPHSNTDVAQVFMSELVPYSSPLPEQGVDEVASEAALVLQHDEMAIVQSELDVKQAVSVSLIYTGEPLPISKESVPSYAQEVLQKADYPAVGDMTGVYLYQSRMNVLQRATNYDNPDIIRSASEYAGMREVVLYNASATFEQSQTRLGSAGLEWLVSVTMPSPGDMIPPTRSALVPSVANLTLQVKPTSFEQSNTRSLQVATKALQHSFYDTPEDIFNRGLFGSLVAEQRTSPDFFPDPSDMRSPSLVYSVLEQLAAFDKDFHDPSEDAQEADVYMAAEQLAIEVEFPDPTGPQSNALGSLIGEQLAVGTSFPDPTGPQSNAQVWQTAEQVAAVGEFPDPAGMMSPASSTQVSEQVAQRSAFFDPTKPASTVQVTLVEHMFAMRDTSLYGVPENAIKHRPIITVNIVYSRES